MGAEFDHNNNKSKNPIRIKKIANRAHIKVKFLSKLLFNLVVVLVLVSFKSFVTAGQTGGKKTYKNIFCDKEIEPKLFQNGRYEPIEKAHSVWLSSHKNFIHHGDDDFIKQEPYHGQQMRYCPDAQIVEGYESDEMMICGFRSSHSTNAQQFDGLKVIYCHKYDWQTQSDQTTQEFDVFNCQGGNLRAAVNVENWANKPFYFGRGDCDDDSDCAPGLTCAQSDEMPSVGLPGLIGAEADGSFLGDCIIDCDEDDFCYDTAFPYLPCGNDQSKYGDAVMCDENQYMDYVEIVINEVNGGTREIAFGCSSLKESPSEPSEKNYVYQLYTGKCVHGANIVRFSSKTVEECEAICESISNCQAFEYGFYHGETSNIFQLQPGDCQPQSSSDIWDSDIGDCDGYKVNMNLYVKERVTKFIGEESISRYSKPKQNDSLENAFYCAISSVSGAVDYENSLYPFHEPKIYIGLMGLYLGACDAYDCRNTLRNPNKPIQNQVYKLVEGNTKFQKLLVKDYMINTDNLNCPINYCQIMENCNTTTPNLLNKYTKIENSCIAGYNILSFYNQTVESCKQICDMFSDCIVFSFRKDNSYMTSSHPHKFLNCWLQHTIGERCDEPTTCDLYLKNESNPDIWTLSQENLTSLATNDPEWETIELFQVNPDPDTVFEYLNICIQCKNIDRYGKSDQTFLTNSFNVTKIRICKHNQVLDPGDQSKCISCPEYFMALNGTCVTSSKLLNELGINFAPIFKEEPSPTKIILSQQNPLDKFEFALPEYLDVNEQTTETISVNVTGLDKTFMTFDKNLNVITFKNLEPSKAGTYKVNITLQDPQQASTTQEFMFVIIYEEEQVVDTKFGEIIMEQYNQDEKEEIEEIKLVELGTMYCHIKNVSTFGKVYLEFSHDLKYPQIGESIDESDLDVQIMQPEIFFNQLSNENEYQREPIFIEWKALCVSSRHLMIQIIFDNPLLVSSSGVEQDLIRVEFLQNASSFISKESNSNLNESSLILSSRIMAQNLQTNTAMTIVQVEEDKGACLTVGFWLTLLFNQMVSGEIPPQVYVAFLESLQMIVYLPLLGIRFPASIMNHIQVTRPIAMFDILDGLQDTEYEIESLDIFDQDDTQFDEQKFPDQFEDLEFESLNSIINLGSMTLFIGVYYTKVGILGLQYIHQYLTFSTSSEFTVKHLKTALFNELIVLTIEGSIDICIAGYLQTLRELRSKEFMGDNVSVIFGYVCKLMISIIFLIYCFVIRQNQETLRSQQFKERFGAFYRGIKTESTITLSYRFVFLLRRISFCFLVFGLESNSLKACFLFLQNMLYTIYLGNFKPKEGKLFQILEMVNELLVQAVTVHLFPIQDMHQIQKKKEVTIYEVGYSMSSFLTLLEIINVLVVLWYSMRQIYLFLLVSCNKLDLIHLKLTNTFLIYCLGHPKPPKKIKRVKKKDKSQKKSKKLHEGQKKQVDTRKKEEIIALEIQRVNQGRQENFVKNGFDFQAELDHLAQQRENFNKLQKQKASPSNDFFDHIAHQKELFNQQRTKKASESYQQLIGFGDNYFSNHANNFAFTNNDQNLVPLKQKQRPLMQQATQNKLNKVQVSVLKQKPVPVVKQTLNTLPLRMPSVRPEKGRYTWQQSYNQPCQPQQSKVPNRKNTIIVSLSDPCNIQRETQNQFSEESRSPLPSKSYQYYNHGTYFKN